MKDREFHFKHAKSPALNIKTGICMHQFDIRRNPDERIQCQKYARLKREESVLHIRC